MNDKFTIVNVATIDIRMRFSPSRKPRVMPLVTAQVPITRIKGKLIFDPSAECGGKGMEQAADNRRTRFRDRVSTAV